MRLWKSLCSIVLPLFIAKRAKADDGPIDFSQAPGYEDLRACAAHWIYNGRLINDLKGCPKISVCIFSMDLEIICSPLLSISCPWIKQFRNKIPLVTLTEHPH